MKKIALLFVFLFIFSFVSGGLQAQGQWKHADPIIFPFPVEDSFSLMDERNGTIHFYVRHGEVLEHWIRGSLNPFPLQHQATLEGSYHGCGSAIIFSDGNYLLSWPQGDILKTWWSTFDDWGDPSNPNPPSTPKLVVSEGVLSYGDVTKFCGASDRLALWKETGEYLDIDPWHAGYNLAKYEKDIIDSGVNCVRELGSMNTQFMIDHVLRMKAHGIIVEIEVYDHALKPNPVVAISRMGELAELGNVYFGVGNEFLNYADDVAIVADLCDQLILQDCLVSAGAWGYSHDGKQNAQAFHDTYSSHQLEAVHRNWDLTSWNEALEYNKPVTWNEIFNNTGLTLADIDNYMSDAFDAGVQMIHYYHWFNDCPLEFNDILQVCKNQLSDLN